MKQEHFEILLERVEHNTEVSLEAISGTNQRLDRLENDMNQRFENVEKRLDRNDHESRIQGLENNFRDHLVKHSE